MAVPFVPQNAMQPPPGISPGPHSHIVCGGCATLLMFPQQGASNVRCQRCAHVTPVPAQAGQPADTQQIVCNSCRVLLSYPRGAQSVQCSLCSTITQVPVYGHLRCAGCSVTLLYPSGARSVKCAMCHVVTNVADAPLAVLQQPQAGGSGALPPAGPGHQRPPGQQQQQHEPGRQTVVVENPAAVDEQGNEMPNIVVGVTDRQP